MLNNQIEKKETTAVQTKTTEIFALLTRTESAINHLAFSEKNGAPVVPELIAEHSQQHVAPESVMERLNASLSGSKTAESHAGVEETVEDTVEVTIDAQSDYQAIETQHVDAIVQSFDLKCDSPVISVVMPCLNEADTLRVCIQKAKLGLRDANVQGEIIIADNGSDDGSQEIARSEKVRLIDVPIRGYGAALMAGIESSRGEYVIMGDADDSYDFRTIPDFIEALKSGADLAQGCRLPKGGGEVLPNAMPWLHRWIGNPMLTFLANSMFRAPINDVYCGLRAFRRSWQSDLGQRCTGMEFAVEMIVKGSLFKAKFAEVPIKLHPDGRVTHSPHLCTFRDGWRTLKFFLLHSPKFTLLMPGLVLATAALVGMVLSFPSFTIAGITFGAHTLLVSMLALLVGTQMMSCAVIAKTFAASSGLLPKNSRLDAFLNRWTLDRKLAACGLLTLCGMALIGTTAFCWMLGGFGALNYASTMRFVIPGVGLIALAAQLTATSFVLSILRIKHR